jgi:hypothetical protein
VLKDAFVDKNAQEDLFKAGEIGRYDSGVSRVTRMTDMTDIHIPHELQKKRESM